MKTEQAEKSHSSMKTEIGNDKKPPLKTNKILLLKAAIFLLIGQRTLERNTLIILDTTVL